MQSGTALTDAQEAMRLADTDPGRAAPVAEAALRRARRERDPVAAALAQRAWGHALLQCGEVDPAIVHLRQSIAYSRRAGSPDMAGEARSKLAYALVMLGRPRTALAEIEAALRDLDGVAGARARAQRAVILSEIGRLDEALADFQEALPALRAAPDELGVARMLVNRGILYAQRHAFAAAVSDLREAEGLSRRLGRELAVGIIAQNLGYVETLRGDVPAALAQLDRAERIIGMHGGRIASVRYDRGLLLLSVGLAGEARQAAESAVQAFHRAGRRLKVPEARLLHAEAAFAGRDWPEAVRQAERAMMEFSRQHRIQWSALARLTMVRARMAAGESVDRRRIDTMVGTLAAAGWPAAAVEAQLTAARVEASHGRTGAAEEYLLGASRAARRRGPATVRARGWYAQALLHHGRGDGQRASSAIRSGLRILEAHGASLGAIDLRVHAAAHRGELVELGLRIAIDARRPRRLLEWSERSRASLLAYRPARPPHDPQLADLLAELRRVALELDQVGTGDGSALVRRQIGLERHIRDHSRRRVGGDDPRAGPVRLADLGTALGACALVEFVQLDGVLFGLSVVDSRLRTRVLGDARPVADLVRRLPFALRRLANRRTDAAGRAAAVALLRQAASTLDGLLLRPFNEIDDRPLVVVPTGGLHSVPWSVLPSCVGRPVAVSPSATLWRAANARPPADGRVAVVAGPRLPGAREEALAVAALHHVDALVDGQATVASVIDALASAAVVHLAAHGRLSTDNPLFSHLLLADGPLVVYDLEQVARTPPTVVLAACDSGRPVVYAGDEMLGLSTTFIARGTAHLIASVLPIPDAETAPLMVALHRRLAAGVAPAVALAASQREVGDDSPDAIAAAAGFVCLGSGFAAARGAGQMGEATRT